MKNEVLLLTCGLVLLFSPSVYADIIIGSYTFSDIAFADDATYISGDPTYIGHDPGESWHSFAGNTTTDLDAALTGPGLTLGIDGDGMNFDLFFTDNFVVNGPGPDLVVFETITPEDFDLAVYVSGSFTAFSRYLPSSTGYTVGDIVGTTNTGELNAREIDLDDFGVSAGGKISTIRISSIGGASGTAGFRGADIVAVGALNSAAIPEPTSLLLLGVGLGAFGIVASRRRMQ